HRLARGLAKKFRSTADVRFREMRVIKSDHWDAQRFAAGNRFPCYLIWVARLDQVRPFTFQNLLNRPQVNQCAVTRCSRNERRMNEIDSRAFARDAFRFRSWN